MKIAIIGSGRIGLSLGASLAKSGISVLMTDKDSSKKLSVKAGSLSFYEPGLKNCLLQNQDRLLWTRYTEKILSADMIFFCLSAAYDKKGFTDLTDTFHWARLIVEHTKTEKYLIIKSTFPLGSNRKITEMVLEKGAPLHVITCPEFLRQGQALKDLSAPERLVIGARNRNAGEKIEELYKRFSQPKKVIYTDPETAELSKLASNSFLAAKISLMNEFSGLCEQVCGNPQELKLILGSDPRIGEYFLNPGLGYGGYCLPKDIDLVLCEGKKRNHSMKILQSVKEVNSQLALSFFKKIKEYHKNLKGVPLAFWGLSFKKNTDDLKNSPALHLLCRLLKAGAELHVYDPLFVRDKVFMFFDRNSFSLFQDKKLKKWRAFFKNFFEKKEDFLILKRKILSGEVLFYTSPLKSLDKRKGLIIASDCDEFKSLPLSEIKKSLSEAFLVDGRNLFSPEELKKTGFCFYQKGFSSIKRKQDF